jgi:Cu(I)/Ag(I) efflux system protein CusF
MKFNNTSLAAFTLAINTFFLPGAFAQSGMDHSHMNHMNGHAAGAMSDAAHTMTEAEVKKVDLQTQSVTLKHGPIENLGMSAMTMSFKAKSPALLANVQSGDKVRFAAEMPNGVLTLTSIELAK